MKVGIFLLPSLAAMCYSAALPVEHGGEVLKRDSEDYTETVTVTAPKPTSKTTSNQASYVTVTVTETNRTSTVKRTTNSKKGTKTVFGSPTKPLYKTVTEIVTKPTTIYSTPPSYTTVTASYCDDTIEVCSGDDSSATTDGGLDWISLDWGSLTFGVNKEKRQIWLDPFTTTDYACAPTSDGWNGAEVTSTVTETEEIVTKTVYTEKAHNHHTTTASAPRVTSSTNLEGTVYLGFQTFDKRQIWLNPFTTTDYATPQSTSDYWNGGEVTSTVPETEEVVTTTVYTERSHHHHTTTTWAPSISSSVNLDTTLYLGLQTFDKRQTFSATLELNGPSETDFFGFYSSETTDGGEYGPYGSWYPVETDAPDADPQDIDTDTIELDNKKRNAAPQDDSQNIGITFGDGSSTEPDDTVNLGFQTFDKRSLKTPGCADEAQVITVTVTSFIEKPTGLVNQGVVSIRRTIIEAPTGSGTTSSSSNSSVSSPAKTTFATRARIDLKD